MSKVKTLVNYLKVNCKDITYDLQKKTKGMHKYILSEKNETVKC